MKSRPAVKQLIPPKPEGQTVFKLVTTNVTSSDSNTVIKLTEIGDNGGAIYTVVPQGVRSMQ